MFETAELGRAISKKDFKKIAPVLRQELLELQDDLRKQRHFQTVLVFAGVDGGGKGETVGLLNAWMDARWLITRAYDEVNNGDHDRPDVLVGLRLEHLDHVRGSGDGVGDTADRTPTHERAKTKQQEEHDRKNRRERDSPTRLLRSICFGWSGHRVHARFWLQVAGRSRLLTFRASRWFPIHRSVRIGDA